MTQCPASELKVHMIIILLGHAETIEDIQPYSTHSVLIITDYTRKTGGPAHVFDKQQQVTYDDHGQ